MSKNSQRSSWFFYAFTQCLDICQNLIEVSLKVFVSPASLCWHFLCPFVGTFSGARRLHKQLQRCLGRRWGEPASSVGGPDGGGIQLPQLLIEIPAPAGYAIGFALALYIAARAILIALPILSDKAARRLALMRGHRITRKRK